MQPRTHTKQRCRHGTQHRWCINPTRQPGEQESKPDAKMWRWRKRRAATGRVLRRNGRELLSRWCFVSNKCPCWKIPRARPSTVPAGGAELSVCEGDATGKFAAAAAALQEPCSMGFGMPWIVLLIENLELCKIIYAGANITDVANILRLKVS